MRLKTKGRLGGIFQAGFSSYISYTCYDLLSNANYSFFLENHPIEHKIICAAYTGTVTAFAMFFTLGTIDGIVDSTKGTHHYFGCKVIQRLAKNSGTKKKIQLELEEQLRVIEK